jgi:hypothetical protein
MSCDKLVFDLSQEVEGSPNVFIRKDWINILDNQNQNYQNNQSIIDTSQLANSNKYMSYRESYLAIPMTLSYMVQPGLITAGATPGSLGYQTAGTMISDNCVGLKNWFGQIIHSMTLDYNGTTIVQQTPFCNMWNTFKLLTTLSWADVATQGPTLGFYPDTSDSYGLFSGNNVNKNGSCVCNNDIGISNSSANWSCQSYSQFTTIPNSSTSGSDDTPTGGNRAISKRNSWINYDVTDNVSGAKINQASNTNDVNASMFGYNTYGISGNLNQIWRSNVFNRVNLPEINALTANTNFTPVPGIIQIAIMGTIYLKHIHSFFNMCPLLKGVFMKLTLNLNNCNSSIPLPVLPAGLQNVRSDYGTFGTMTNPSALTNVFVGGVCPILCTSMNTGNKYLSAYGLVNTAAARTSSMAASTIYLDLVVGSKVYNNNMIGKPGFIQETTSISKSIYLYVPAYTFNPTFEQAYLSNNIKQIKYTDIYQYQVLNVDGGQQFNNLITNGIANIKSVLIIPFFNRPSITGNINVTTDNLIEYQSVFDTAGCGTTAPLVSLGNFNIQISGQNAIYNMQRYSFEEWNNQLYGQNAVNGGLTDGLTSGLINFHDFEQSYCYYYVNVERMLPVEQSVPKSVQILGTNYSQKSINLWVFVEYGVQVQIDVLTGARV